MTVIELAKRNTGYSVFSHQVECDINFLQSRLHIMRSQHTPNQQVIRTYEEMLRSRLNVLARLQDECQSKAQAG